MTNNSTDASGSLSPDMSSSNGSEIMRYFIIAVAIFSIVVGITGNFIIVIVRIFKQLQRKNTTAYTFLVSQLAIADLLFAFTIIFALHEHLHLKWVFGAQGCRLIKVTQSVSLTTTVGFLTVMAYERYRGISKPLQHRWSIKKTSFIVIGIWIYIFLTFIPYLLALDVGKSGYCEEIHHSSTKFKQGYTLFLFLTNFVAPLCCVTVFHTLIVVRMKKHLKSMRDQRHRSSPSIKRKIKNNNARNDERIAGGRNMSTASTYSEGGGGEDAVCAEGETNCWVALYKLLRSRFGTQYRIARTTNNNNYQPSPTAGRRVSSSRRRRSTNIFRRLISSSKTNEDRKLIKMLVAVTLSFAVMTLPTQIYFLWVDFLSEKEAAEFNSQNNQFISRLIEVFSSLVYLHCCSNCVIYSAMDKRFRSDVKKTIQYIFNCTPKKNLRQSFQRVTVVSRLSRSSRHYSTTTSTTSSSNTRSSSRYEEKSSKKKPDDVQDVDDCVFVVEKETVIV